MQHIIPVGEIIDNRFKVCAPLGEGGFGSVFLAEQIGMDRKVAIKLVHFADIANDESLKRFNREGQVMAGLHHKNIASCYAYGLWRNKVPYLALEYLAGESLFERLKREKKLSWKTSFQIAIQFCRALSEMHRHSIIHRDLKPDNIIILTDGTVKLIDFGLAAIDGQRLTKTGMVVGSLLYLSPEQACAAPVTQLSDIYAVGCILYHMISGVPPFVGSVPVEILQQHAGEQAVPLRQLDDSVPKVVENIVAQCMSKEPSLRFASADELIVAMESALNKDHSSLKIAAVTACDVGGKKQKHAWTVRRSSFLRLSLLGLVSALIVVVGVSALYLDSRARATERIVGEIKDCLAKAEGERFKGLLTSQYTRAVAHLTTSSEIRHHLGKLQGKDDGGSLLDIAERERYLDLASLLALERSVPDDIKAKVLLAQRSVGARFFYKQLPGDLRQWLHSAEVLLQGHQLHEDFRKPLVDACDDVRCVLIGGIDLTNARNIGRIKGYGCAELLKDPAIQQFDELATPLLKRVPPPYAIPDHWGPVLKRYGIVQVLKGRSRPVSDYLGHLFFSKRTPNSVRVAAGQSLAFAQIADNRVTDAAKTISSCMELEQRPDWDESCSALWQCAYIKSPRECQQILNAFAHVRGYEKDVSFQNVHDMYAAGAEFGAGHNARSLKIVNDVLGRTPTFLNMPFSCLLVKTTTLIAEGDMPAAKACFKRLTEELHKTRHPHPDWIYQYNVAVICLNHASTLADLTKRGQGISAAAIETRLKLATDMPKSFCAKLSHDNFKAVTSPSQSPAVHNKYFGTCLLNEATAYDTEHNWRALAEILPRYESSVEQFSVGWKTHLFRLIAKAEAALGHDEKCAAYGRKSLDNYLLNSKADKQQYILGYPDFLEDFALMACKLKNPSAKNSLIEAITNCCCQSAELAGSTPYRVAEYFNADGSYEAADKIYEHLQTCLNRENADLANRLFAAQRRCRNLIASNKAAQARSIATEALKIPSPEPDPVIDQMHEELRQFLN